MFSQLFYFFADHRSINNGNADFVFANGVVCLPEGIGIIDFVHAARRILDRLQEFLIFCQHEDINGT